MLSHLTDAVRSVQARRAARPLTYRVVRRGKPTSANWATELAGIPAELVDQARAAVAQRNQQAGFAAYDLWSW